VTRDEGWVKVGEAARWVKGRGRRVVVEGAPVAIFFDGARWIAVDDTCPHMGASLADGHLVGDLLQCSWHEWRYDTHTGQCPLRDWARVRVHEVRIERGDVWIRVPRPPKPAEAPPGDEDDPEWMRWDPARYFKK
jgi:nitrite reductase (NADH) small subunit